MASEIRVNQIQNRSGLSTVTFSDTGVVISGITTISDLRTSGTTVVAAGTTSAPSISPTGDSNTGIFFPSLDTVAIAEGGVEALRIDSSSNIGIGTTGTGDRLTVLGRVQIQQDSGSNNRLILRGQPGSTYRWNIDNNGSSNDLRIFREDDVTTAGGLVYASLSSSGNLTLNNGNLVIGTAGKGIDFSASSNAAGMTSELLDDYEEGTWTAALVGTTAASYDNQGGKYVKIGRMVHVQCLLQTSSQTFSNTASLLQISGLPFTPNDNTAYNGTPGSVISQYVHWSASYNDQSINGTYLSCGTNGTNIVLQTTSTGGVRATLRNLAWGQNGLGTNGAILELNLTYYTTS